ncbi:MAG: TetR/AcrR family transcriptional regulator [Oscillospiraceae bacterium]|nr:TetR/AcrR family transcriptional regulator [Oscillospiraceae bacterium]
MSFIDYDLMSKTTDIRIVKTRRIIHSAVIELLKIKHLSDISITELCQTAMINRKTFYMHYKSVEDAFSDIETLTINAYIARLVSAGILSSKDFKPAEFILATNAMVNENIDKFNTVYPYFKDGGFMRKFGAAIGTLAKKFAANRPLEADPEAYAFSFIFTSTGLLTSYFDWIDFGKQITIEHQSQMAANALSVPLCSVLSSK